MPNFSGLWTVTQQMQAKGASTWPTPPGAPTIGTATAGSTLCASVTFTAPSCAGYPASVTGYRVVSTPGCLTATGASSPLVVSGLTDATSYTFKAQATNATGYGALSAASNSITASNAGQQAYTSAGTYSWVAPAGVTSVSVVAVGGGAGGLFNNPCLYGAPNGGGGGGLSYKNNYSVNPGCSYTVVVGAGGPASSCGCTGTHGGSSYFVSTGLVRGGGGVRPGATIPNVVGDGGGKGGSGGYGCGGGGKTAGGGGGAGGYSGCGGRAGYDGIGGFTGFDGSGGGGGGGGRSNSSSYNGGAGGGVGILGQGSNGTGGAFNLPGGGGGGGGSGGASGTTGVNSGVANGGAYGGGGASGRLNAGTAGTGGGGAVRIIWPGTTRQFPSTNTGDV